MPGVPSGGWRRPRRRQRLLAVLAARDESRFIDGLLANLAPQLDGLVALDDGSTDGTDATLASSPIVLELLRNPVDRERWDEVGNHRRLVEAAIAHGATWILAVDADERVEHTFRDRAERVIRRAGRLGIDGVAIQICDLWGDTGHIRTDGIWGRKRAARLFRARSDHRFDTRELHAHKAPLQSQRGGRFVPADLRLYHLRMVTSADREARRRRYDALDPDARWQPEVGYAYLTDETGLTRTPVDPRRGFREEP